MPGFNLGDSLRAAGEWLLQNRAAIENWFSEATNGVTNVKRWINQTSSRITIKKVDGRGRFETINIAPNQTVDQDMWLPWCNSQQEYPEKHVTFEVDGRRVSFSFQHGANIRISESDAFNPNAINFPGFSKAGGERKMVFEYSPSRNVIFRLEPFRA